MHSPIPTQVKKRLFSWLRSGVSLAVLFLLIEFYDELYSIGAAALPTMRQDLALSYAEVGLLLGLPPLINTLVEPLLMLLGDTRLRKTIMVAGGAGLALSTLLIAGAGSFPAILIAFTMSRPSGGAFVTLSQATLMDLNPGREAQGMARWTVAGTLGDLVGPLLLAGGFALALGWRWAYLLLAAVGLALTALLAGRRLPQHPAAPPGKAPDLKGLLAGLWDSLRNPNMLRWILLGETADLLMDVFTGYMPLYFTDLVHFTAAQASLVLGLYTLCGLANSLLLIPLLERIPGRTLVRVSAAVTLVLYLAWLALPWPAIKVTLALAIGLAETGWYAVISGEAYAAGNGRSGTVKAIDALGGVLGGLFAWVVGWFAGIYGLQAAMFLLALGPVSLLILVPGIEDVQAR